MDGATAKDELDTLYRDGDIALAKRLQQYWHDQGYPTARFWTEPLDERFSEDRHLRDLPGEM
jgi:hypothetical protein